ncbi:DUF3077 domain-containing protein [uncultured Pseudomonas sp.]|uniref:DUF6124 family protein n=1 Tax=uncultured Pseudomonas sp. TaxID=114707 RepID=UPI0025DD3F22|nr:DUF3077 domain-containing protein [uncultured Pseudomonas sp.]
MKKITPNPPDSFGARAHNKLTDGKMSDVAQRAIDHYLREPVPEPTETDERPPRRIFSVGADVGTEEALANATEILSSALETAYRCADGQDSIHYRLTMGLAQLIENAQALVDSVLDRQFTADNPADL